MTGTDRGTTTVPGGQAGDEAAGQRLPVHKLAPHPVCLQRGAILFLNIQQLAMILG